MTEAPARSSVALSELTTMRVGGLATRLVEPTTRDDLVAVALETWSSGDEWLVLGGGSNLVVGDDGFDGTVIRVAHRGIEVDPTRAGLIRVQAGEPWGSLVDFTVERGLAGIEALAGVPGSCGAAPIQNIGAYGQELSDTLVGIEFLDFDSGEVETLTTAELAFGYRTSALKRGRRGVVLSLDLQLETSGRGRIAYPQLAAALGADVGDAMPLPRIRAQVLALRASKGMVLDAADPDSVSCGSFFTNPIVTETFAYSLPKDAPRWPVESEAPDQIVPLGEHGSDEQQLPATVPLVKLSAAWLIEHAGIARGYALPGSAAAISSKHTLAITNRGGATAEQVAELARLIRARVVAEFGVLLQPEPTGIGVEL